MMDPGIYKAFQKQSNDVLKGLLGFRAFPNPVEIGVGFKDMQMGIHGFACVEVFIAEPQIINGLPVPPESFHVAILASVKAVLLDEPE